MIIRLVAPFAASCVIGLSAGACFGQPAIVSGRISTPTVNVTKPAASPEFDLVLSGKVTSVGFLFQGPSGEFASTGVSFPAGLPSHAHVRGYLPSQYGTLGLPNQAFSLYTEAGTWTLATGQVCDADGNCSGYDSRQLAALFPTITFQVKNPNEADFSAPYITQGVIRTPDVRLNGKVPLKLDVTATDDVSGVASESICATLTGSSTQLCFNSGPFYGHALTGTFPIVYQLPGNTAPGTYTITSVGAIDVAGNYVNYTNPGEINGIFHDNVSFTVTQ